MKSTLLSVGLLTLALSGCDMGSSNTMIVTGPDLGTGGGIVDPTGTGGAGVCDYNKTYQGFAGKLLQAGASDEELGADRDRVKPYDALVGEYQRVLGTTPGTAATALLSQLNNSFGLTPARWFQEPQATAISLYSSMRVAFVGCSSFTTSAANAPTYSVAPTEANAPALCAQLEKKFWSRDPDSEEISNCVTVAVNGTTDEPDPNIRWAYTCAAVLSSADFLTF